MKKVHPWTAAAVAAALVSSAVEADMHEYRGRYEPVRHQEFSRHHHENWVVPLVIGGVLGYVLSEPRRENVTYVQSSPVIYAPEPVYQERWVYFSDCDCQRKVLVRVR